MSIARLFSNVSLDVVEFGRRETLSIFSLIDFIRNLLRTEMRRKVSISIQVANAINRRKT